ncbi:MAG TPA: inositol monophosphatase [Firmicutes bacterium]|nr:inositol monophosphatase [Bacillota bacterium]
MKKEWKEALDLSLKTGRGAARILADGFGNRDMEIFRKEGRELVTVYDRKAEAFIIRELETAGWPVIAEESKPRLSDGAKIYWAVDPLDGTNNFAYGVPHFAVSIALMEEGQPVTGAIVDPLKKEEFTAVRGGGSFLNGNPITVSAQRELSRALLATGFSYNRSEAGYNNMENFKRIVLCCGGIRRMGAASLDLAYVACGRFDGYWETDLKIWDMAAGVLLVREGGGRASRLNGAPWDPGRDDVLTATPGLHPALVKLMDQYD